MLRVLDILETLDKLAPISAKLEFDNAGFIAGDGEAPVSRVLLCMDVTMPVIEEAKEKDCQLIVSHHPLFFKLPKFLRADCFETAKAARLLRYGLSAIGMHTNLDLWEGGVNDVLLDCLALSPLGNVGKDQLGRMGELAAPMDAVAFARQVKEQLGCEGVKVYDAGRPVHKVAVVGGSGGSYVGAALEQGCDTLVTADIKHHQWLEAEERHLNLLDAGHYHTERPVLRVVEKHLAAHHPELTLLRSKTLEQDIVLFV
ncbi:MAG: Nif3-like dinuclear metal center hexameric protein [Clostridia bacterium]|nr:Nif3-like dinuclear metal center hexameric protein [Clostridia bacterium]